MGKYHRTSNIHILFQLCFCSFLMDATSCTLYMFHIFFSAHSIHLASSVTFKNPSWPTSHEVCHPRTRLAVMWCVRGQVIDGWNLIGWWWRMWVQLMGCNVLSILLKNLRFFMTHQLCNDVTSCRPPQGSIFGFLVITMKWLKTFFGLWGLHGIGWPIYFPSCALNCLMLVDAPSNQSEMRHEQQHSTMLCHHTDIWHHNGK